MSFERRDHFRLKTARDSCPSARICGRLVMLTDWTATALSNEKSKIRTEYSSPRSNPTADEFVHSAPRARAVEDGRLCRRSPRNRTHTAPPTTSPVATAFPRRRQHHEGA